MATPLESYPWWCKRCYRLNKKTHDKCPNCSAHWSTGERHNTEPKALKNYSEDWNQDWANWREGGDTTQRWSSRSPSRSRFGQQDMGQSVKSPRQRNQGKGAQGKGAQGKGKASGKEAVSDQQSPFATSMPLAYEPWAQIDSSTFVPTSAAASSPFQLASIDGGIQEMASALRKAYPDANKRPDDVQSMLDKADKEASRLGLKNLHQAAKHLDRSKKQLKEVVEQKKIHRQTWIKHLTESIQVWEKQLKDFKRHQEMLTGLANKARTEISSTSRAIQALGAAGTGSALPANLSAEPAEVVDTPEEQADKDAEEEDLRIKMQKVLRACASSLGSTAEGTPIEIDSDAEMEEEKPPPKRIRSNEPRPPFSGS